MRRRARTALLLCLCLLTPLPAGAQAAKSDTLDDLTARAREAIARSAYESGVKILTDAKTRYPDSPAPNLALGDLYYEKELYSLALAEYREAERKGAADFATLSQISRCYGKLNQEARSIEYLTRILKEHPDSAETIDDLGWMYFKTHQLDKGEEVVRDGITRLGMQRGMCMTLGTLYSGMNRYEESRKYYLKSVEEALRVNDRDFASIAYYNLSLLEHNFFNYNSALRFTDESIAMEDRPSGHLARGELAQSRMDFPMAEREYQEAYAVDTTPLSKVNLAILYQKSGRLDLARRYAEEVFGSKDLAWLLYYGTDLTRHFKDLYELLGLIYDGLAVRELRRPTRGAFDRAAALVTAARYRLIAWYHTQRFHLFSVKAGTQYLEQGSSEDAWWEYYRGNEDYREVALKYLTMARALETARTPHANVFYMMEEGKESRSTALLEEALTGFDPFWEREASAETLLSLIPLLKGAGHLERRREAIVQLYRLNPGALPQAGIGLPLAVELNGSGWTAREKGLIMRFVGRSGSECREGSPAGFLHVLRMVKGDGNVIRWTVAEKRTGTVLASGENNTPAGVHRRCAAIMQVLLEELYAVH
jgi:tetratricopeptide (TPR) repeat protein